MNCKFNTMSIEGIFKTIICINFAAFLFPTEEFKAKAKHFNTSENRNFTIDACIDVFHGQIFGMQVEKCLVPEVLNEHLQVF